VAPPQNKGFMNILGRLEQWEQQGKISPEQNALLASLWRRESFSLFLELNLLFYAGVLAFVGGLGWTVSTWSQQLGDVLVLRFSPQSSPPVFGIVFPARPSGLARKRPHQVQSSTMCFTSAA
jgi:hypothetical protein